MALTNNQEFYTQDEIVDILRNEGFLISIRTLRYWRSIEKIPLLNISTGVNAKYHFSAINIIREACINSDRRIGEEIFSRNLEGVIYKVFQIVITKPDKYQVQYNTNKGLLIERRDNLNGIY
jgi:arginine repressor